jgi:hypothetical protein
VIGRSKVSECQPASTSTTTATIPTTTTAAAILTTASITTKGGQRSEEGTRGGGREAGVQLNEYGVLWLDKWVLSSLDGTVGC